MPFTLPTLSSLSVIDNIPVVTYCVAGVIAIIIATKLAQPSKLDAIPSVGSNGWFDCWRAAFQCGTNVFFLLHEGYKKNKSAPFKVPTPFGWTVVIGNCEHADEVRRAPDDILPRYDSLQVEYTLGSEIFKNPYHLPIMRSRLTRNIDVLYPEIRQELIIAFDDVMDLKGNEWKRIPVLSSMQQIISRTTNRVLVGDPLCHNSDWMDLNVRHTIDILKAAVILRLFPKFLKPWATRYITSIYKNQEQGKKLLGPIIEERRKYMNEYGKNWTEQPNDYLSWLMEEAKGPESTIEFLTRRLLTANFAAIHTTSTSVTHALYYLAGNPQYIQPLREEVQGIVDKEGWSKSALSKMHKVDSFLRECQRMEGLTAMSVTRLAAIDFTLSDGTVIPKGTKIGVATHCIHNDDEYYPNAGVFDPFRFVEMQEKDDDGGKHQFASTSIDYQPFGHGRHACPGRFFAASELKTMLAHIVMECDVKLKDGTTRLASLHFGDAIFPNPNAHILFRRRVN